MGVGYSHHRFTIAGRVLSRTRPAYITLTQLLAKAISRRCKLNLMLGSAYDLVLHLFFQINPECAVPGHAHY